MYIDSEKLIAEIDSRMEDCKLPDGRFPTTTNIVRYEELSCLRNFVNSLQQEQPEVDLEKFDKDVTEIWGRCAAEPNDSIACIHIETFNEVARHFYELGFNARKEE